MSGHKQHLEAACFFQSAGGTMSWPGASGDPSHETCCAAIWASIPERQPSLWNHLDLKPAGRMTQSMILAFPLGKFRLVLPLQNSEYCLFAYIGRLFAHCQWPKNGQQDYSLEKREVSRSETQCVPTDDEQWKHASRWGKLSSSMPRTTRRGSHR